MSTVAVLFITHMVVPSDQIPRGLSLPAAARVPKSLPESRALSCVPYAYSLPSSQSGTHIVVPSDHKPIGTLLPAASSVLKSSAGLRSPGDGVMKVTLVILSVLLQPALL